MNLGELKHLKTVTPDSRGRVNLSGLLEGVDRLYVYRDHADRLVLAPVVEIPANEMWVYKNPEVLASIYEGARQSEAGEIYPAKEDYTKYIDDDDSDED